MAVVVKISILFVFLSFQKVLCENVNGVVQLNVGTFDKVIELHFNSD